MKMAQWVLVFALLFFASSASAQEYFYENGAFVGLGVQGSITTRDRTVHYGFPAFCGPTPFCVPAKLGFKGTDINDSAVSPVLTFGYQLSDNDTILFKGDYAHYKASGHFLASDSTGFITIAVDGANGTFVPPTVGADTNINTDWESDAATAAIEYQRRLTKGELGGLFGLLGVKMRYEGQSFDAKAVNPTVIPSPIVDSYHESLQSFLYGPYAGLKLGLKPNKDSKWNFGFRGNVGWYFKHATFDGKDRFFNGQHFSQDDKSTKGTLFAGAGANIVYAINRHWFIDAFYEFNWIQSAPHIWNTRKTPADASAATPSRIVGTTLITHNPGVKLIYKFD